MTQREEFEAWFVKAYHPASLQPTENGCYLNLGAGMAWDAWQAAQSAQHTQVVKDDIAAAWVAGYYHAGYTHDGAYAVKTADDFAAEWATQPAHHLPEAGNMVQQPAQNEWKEAVIEQLAAHSMDAPVSDSPTVILEKIINMAVLQATDPGVNGGWKLVPVEPTEAMVYQGIRAARYLWTPDSNSDFTSAYKAMLSAAPSTKEKIND